MSLQVWSAVSVNWREMILWREAGHDGPCPVHLQYMDRWHHA